MRFEVIDVCYNTLVLEDDSFSSLSHKEQALSIEVKFHVVCQEEDVLAYKRELASFEILDRQLIAEQYYGHNIQYTDTSGCWDNP